MSQFYLTLPSNAVSAKDLKKPSLNSFRVQLAQSIKLHGEWEVALAEISYPHSWFNVSENKATFTVLYKSWNNNIPEPKSDCQIFDTQYNTIDQLLEALNTAYKAGLEQAIQKYAITDVNRKRLAVSFAYSKETGRVRIVCPTPAAIDKVRFSSHLAYMLGYEVKSGSEISENEIKWSTKEAKYPVDLRAGFYAMYVYCDLVENQTVGQYMEPLLRTVTIEGQHDDVICKIYTNPHYLSLARNEFDSVEILINDDENVPVKFNYGKVIVKLHFRRRKPELF
jgi:hypothetical protein